MTEIQERRISHTELTLLSFKCRTCEAELTFDTKNPKQRPRVTHSLADTLRCPMCEGEFSPHLQGALRDYESWMNKLAAAKQEIVFRLPVPSK